MTQPQNDEDAYAAWLAQQFAKQVDEQFYALFRRLLTDVLRAKQETHGGSFDE